MDNTTYNPHALVTLRKIEGGVESFQDHKATDLEWELDKLKRLQDRLEAATNQLATIQGCLTADNWYSDSTDKDEVLEALCEILSYEPKQSISITATVEVYLTADIPLNEINGFDAETFVTDTLSIDAYNGDINVDDFTVQSADWEEQ